MSSPPSVEALVSELQSLRTRVALLERRRRWSLGVVAGLVAIGLTSRVSLASGSACNEVLPGLLTPFCPDEPAMASVVNQNYRELIKLVETKVGSLSVDAGVAPGAAGSGSITASSVTATVLNATTATVQSLSAARETGFMLSCGAGSFLNVALGNPFCCRMDVSNGDTTCNVATSATGATWSTMSVAYPGLAATTPGRYGLTCSAGAPGANFPFCCRINVNTGAVTCGQGNSYTLGSSGQANVPF
ncbi:MAG: hypothetical protein INH41_10235 [Myxococcaceae bacterium]|jgi:hypothetical protein|nr:hypothetical protein [Myxococcaceae bacterium]MCA3012761.1 hypothetical protein [Myxococcaceae bacterium]